mmetsp:Transcript_27010/g.70641  ORF Transcript_27010/g.70641 Transcript_27010/m.70641 type:complete len:354 (+) Transcript_27010:308-1369(+)
MPVGSLSASRAAVASPASAAHPLWSACPRHEPDLPLLPLLLLLPFCQLLPCSIRTGVPCAACFSCSPPGAPWSKFPSSPCIGSVPKSVGVQNPAWLPLSPFGPFPLCPLPFSLPFPLWNPLMPSGMKWQSNFSPSSKVWKAKHSPHRSMAPSAPALRKRGPMMGSTKQLAHLTPRCSATPMARPPSQEKTSGTACGSSSSSSRPAPRTRAATGSLDGAFASALRRAAEQSPSLLSSGPKMKPSSSGLTGSSSGMVSAPASAFLSRGSTISRCWPPMRLIFSCFRCALCARIGRNCSTRLEIILEDRRPAWWSPARQSRSFWGPTLRQLWLAIPGTKPSANPPVLFSGSGLDPE